MSDWDDGDVDWIWDGDDNDDSFDPDERCWPDGVDDDDDYDCGD
jgi:hypothetical protein